MGIFSQSTTPGASSRRTPRPLLAVLYEAHFADVVSSVRFFGVPERDAKDVAQDVFVRVHASLNRYDPMRPVGPWLKTIAYRTAQDHLRSAHSRRTVGRGAQTSAWRAFSQGSPASVFSGTAL